MSGARKSVVAQLFDGVIPSAAVFQAERGISRAANQILARSLGPLAKARAFGMTPGKNEV
jgi:hypothetical protein